MAQKLKFRMTHKQIKGIVKAHLEKLFNQELHLIDNREWDDGNRELYTVVSRY